MPLIPWRKMMAGFSGKGDAKDVTTIVQHITQYTIAQARELTYLIAGLYVTAALKGGGGRATKTEAVITDTEVLQGGGGKAIKTETVLTGIATQPTGGGGKATKTETVVTDTEVLSLGSL